MPLQYAAYSFVDVKASIVGPGGAFSIGSDAGVAEEGISVEMLEDKDTMVTGADGTPMHSLHAGQGGTITVRLLKVSPLNNLLTVMYDFQTASSSNWGRNTMTVTDFARGDIATGMFCAFRRQPNNTYAKDANILEWSFNCGRILQLLGTGVLVG